MKYWIIQVSIEQTVLGQTRYFVFFVKSSFGNNKYDNKLYYLLLFK